MLTDQILTGSGLILGMLQMLFGYRHYDYRKCPTSFAFVGGKKLLNCSMSEGKKKIEQTSSKIDSTDHVFHSDDSVFACNNLQFIELTFSSPFRGIFLLMAILVSISFTCFRHVTQKKKKTATGLLSTMSEGKKFEKLKARFFFFLGTILAYRRTRRT